MKPTVPTTRYFKSFSGYKIPFRPTDEISETEAIASANYYIGVYADGLLLSFEKVFESERVFLDEYTYWPDTKHLRHRKMTKEDGTIIDKEFDERGRMIE
jgi:hypothetical protein